MAWREAAGPIAAAAASAGAKAATTTLAERLRSHGAYLNRLLERVDPVYYLPTEQPAASNKYMKHKKDEKQISKESAHKFKQQRFDPDSIKTVASIQREQASAQLAARAAKAAGREDDEDEDASDASGTDDSGSESEHTGPARPPGRPVARPEPKMPVVLEEHLGSETPLNELRARLEMRVHALRAQRNAGDLTSAEKAELRARHKQEKAARRKRIKQRELAAASGATAPATPKPLPTLPGADGPKSASAVRFSKFDFGNKPVVIPGMPLKASATTSGKPVSKPDKHGLLKQLEARRNKLSKLKETNAPKAAAIEESMAWQASLARAEGQKVKDDPALLRKTIKRDEKRKQKSKAEWQDRVQKVKAGQAQRQKKRADNIRERSQAKKGTAKKAGSKKSRPGFEGTKPRFRAK